jgi:hypothetical protein
MNLHNFESCIEKIILARGYDYYENNHVTSMQGARGPTEGRSFCWANRGTFFLLAYETRH